MLDCIKRRFVEKVTGTPMHLVGIETIWSDRKRNSDLGRDNVNILLQFVSFFYFVSGRTALLLPYHHGWPGRISVDDKKEMERSDRNHYVIPAFVHS